jgi:hypothetical protein
MLIRDRFRRCFGASPFAPKHLSDKTLRRWLCALSVLGMSLAPLALADASAVNRCAYHQ